MTNAQIGSQWQDAISGYAAPAPAHVIHIAPADLAILKRLDDDTTHWDGVFPDAFKGFSDATGDEEGLS
jgi:hypothetical protein